MRPTLRLVSALAVLLTLAGCARAVDGAGTAPTPTVSTSARAVAAPTYTTIHELMQALDSRPVGSIEWNSPWGNDNDPTIKAFVDHFYDPAYRRAAGAALLNDRLRAIVHRGWKAGDDDEADVILLGFADSLGARDHLLLQTEGWRAQHAASLALASVPSAQGFGLPEYHHDGYQRAVFYTRVRNVVVELWYFCPHRYRPADADHWLAEQVSALR